MTMFSSRPPFNDDPFPFVWPEESRAARISEGPLRSMFSEGDGIDLIRDPRPEFDRPQHNPTNPILASFRANDMNPRAADWARWLDRPSLGAWHHADAAHIDHARRVLTRLANLAGDAS